MINISFDNPYLLLIAIPVLALILIPFLIAVRKENKSKSTTASLILHILIAAFITVALSGAVITSVITKTEVYVVADVSFSANKNLDLIDSYVGEVKDSLPRNSKMGVVCFGKDQALLTPMGEKVKKVSEQNIDDSATDIASALEYTATLFGNDCIKKIVLITDGRDSDPEATSRLISVVERLYADDISIDAIYVDDNISPDTKEIQISGVDFTKSTYLNHEESADILIQSNQDSSAIISLYSSDKEISSRALSLTKGYNVFSFDIPTDLAGTFDYSVKISSEDDTLAINNSYSFTQSVNAELKVLLISSAKDDEARAKELFGERATITSYIITKKNKDVPCSVEELCEYDEIVISNVDIREINNYTAFIDALDKSVSLFGKSLVTMGDLKIQNKTDDILMQLEDMLPVKFGNSDRDPKLYAIVIDSSRSMQTTSRLIMAKMAAIRLLDLLNENDMVMIVNFWGEINVLRSPTPVNNANKEKIVNEINSIEPYQGTVIGTALDKAGDLMINLAFDEKQIMLISDGMSYTLDSDTPSDVVARLYESGITTSVIHTSPTEEGMATLKGIASAGQGKYYEIFNEEDVDKIMFMDIADDLTETVIEKQTSVEVVLPNDSFVDGITSLPDIFGYVYAKSKASAHTPLKVDYVKSSGKTVKAPLFAYWSYGEGRVASFTSTLSGSWSELWVSDEGEAFFSNVCKGCTPDERVGYPYTLNVEYNGTGSSVEIMPADLNPSATVTATVTLPDGTAVTKPLTFDSSRYFYKFETPMSGKYQINIVYSYGERSFETKESFNISYSPEYDSFAVFDPSTLHAAIRNRGIVSEGVVPSLENEGDDIATYTLTLTAPLMILAIIAFIIDIIVRKLKISDVKSFFRSRKGGMKI